MKRFAIGFAVGALLSPVLLAPAFGQIRLYVPDAGPQDQQQYQPSPGQPGSPGNLIGSRVFDREGTFVGTLSSIVTDPQTGQPLYGVVSTGGIFGFGAENHPVPWQLFGFEQNGARLNLGQDRLRNSPKFSANDQPNLLSDRWQRRVSDYFGIQPMRGGQGYGGSQGYPSGQDPFQRLFNRDDISNVRGTVTRVFRQMQGDVTQVSLRTDDGRTIIAVLAPEWYLQNYGAVPQEGETIRVRGSRVTQDGREFLVATMLNTDNQRLQIRSNDGAPLWMRQQEQPYQQQRPYGGQQQYQYGY